MKLRQAGGPAPRPLVLSSTLERVAAPRSRPARPPLQAVVAPGAVSVVAPLPAMTSSRLRAQRALQGGLYVSEGQVFDSFARALRHEMVAIARHNEGLEPGSPDRRMLDRQKVEQPYTRTSDGALFAHREQALAHQLALLPGRDELGL